jgi:hypothetical protein
MFTSNMTLKRPKFDAPYLPKSVVNKFINKTSVKASANKDVVKVYDFISQQERHTSRSSPRSFESVPSMPKTSIGPDLPSLTQAESHTPFVVEVRPSL